MNKIDKAKTFGEEVSRRLPYLVENQVSCLAHAYTAAQHGYPKTSQGTASADKTYYYVMYGWRGRFTQRKAAPLAGEEET